MEKLLPYEQETIINYNNEENTANIYTHDKELIDSLDISIPHYPAIKVVRRGKCWAEYTVPKDWLEIEIGR